MLLKSIHLILLIVLIGYIIFLLIFNIKWMSKTNKKSFNYDLKNLLILNNNNKTIKDNALLISVPNFPFKKLNLKMIANRLIPTQEFIQV